MSEMHKHIVDGREVYFPADRCPICGYKPEFEREAVVYRKGGTIVAKAPRDRLMTVTWWKSGERFLLTVKRMERDENGKPVLGDDNLPVWSAETIRLTVEQAKEFIKLLNEMITEIEVGRSAGIERG